MKKVLTGILLFVSTIVFTQDFFKKRYNPEYNFYDIQTEARLYFEEHGTGKGTGYKQYKRWEYWMEPKVYPSGDMHAAYSDQRQVELENWRANQNSERAIQGSFEEVGKRSWIHANSWNPGMGRVNHVEVHPLDTNIIYVCSPSGGLWKTIDNAESWTCMTDELNVDATSVVAFDPSNSDIMYLATGDRDGGDGSSNGVFISYDSGESWIASGMNGSMVNGVIYDMEVHPNDSAHIFVGATSGLYESIDGAITWTKLNTFKVKDIEFQPGNDSTIYIIKDYHFYVSRDGGQTFVESNQGLPGPSDRVLIAVSPADSNVVYYLYSDGSIFGGLCKSIDAGETFVTMADAESVGNIFGYSAYADDFDGQAWYDMALAVSPNDANEVHVGGILTWRSMDGGSTFENTSIWTYPNNVGYNHADIHYLEYIGNRLFVTSDGGVFCSYNHGDDWIDLSHDLGIAQYYRFDIAATEEIRIVAGAQDNGTTVYNDGEWIEWLGADGMDCVIDPNNIDIIYGSSQNGYFYKTDNGGWSNLADVDGNVDGPWVTPLSMDPNDSEIIYAGNSQLMVSDNGMVQWSEASSFIGGSNIKEIVVAKYFSNVIYVARGNNLYWSDSFGIDWEERSNNLPNLTISYIVLDPEDKDHVFVAMGGYSNGKKVYESTDGGLFWENISGNLPNLSCNSITFYDNDYDALYLGMERGVYYYDKAEGDWTDYSTGLPFVPITELKIHEPSNSLYISTYGRGIWKSELHEIDLSIKENDDLRSSLYPNPVLNNLHIESTFMVSKLEVMNQLGELVFESFPDQVLNNEKVNTENYPAGVYHLILNGDQVRTHNKFVVLKN